MSSKVVAFVAVMSALGNVLSLLSIKIAPIMPSLPLGPIHVSVALDLSHVATFIAALFGGPTIGGLTGLIGGLVAANEFGFSQGNLITGFGLPLGKAITGFVAGLIFRYLHILDGRKLQMVLATLASWLPEGGYTSLLLLVIIPEVLSKTETEKAAMISFFRPVTAGILVKASVEMIIMGLILTAILRNRGFTEYIKSVFM